MPRLPNPPHKSSCHNRRMRNATLSADGRIRYGICAGCGVPMQERVRVTPPPARTKAQPKEETTG